jgi:predicted phage-related endonuclease
MSICRSKFLGGSDAKTVMGVDEGKLLHLWREKRAEAAPVDLSANLAVQLGRATEELNRAWFERNSNQVVGRIQHWLPHRTIPWMAATLDGIVEQTGAVFEAKFMLPWSFSEEAAAQKHAAQLQHNMLVVGTKHSVLSIITGGGKWVEIAVPADPIYQLALLAAEKAFWRCVQTGEPPRLFGAEPPKPRIEAVRVVDMSSSNSWAEFAGIYCRTRDAYQQHEHAKIELRNLLPKDAKEAHGHGVRARRSKSGAISFELAQQVAANAL